MKSISHNTFQRCLYIIIASSLFIFGLLSDSESESGMAFFWIAVYAYIAAVIKAWLYKFSLLSRFWAYAEHKYKVSPAGSSAVHSAGPLVTYDALAVDSDQRFITLPDGQEALLAHVTVTRKLKGLINNHSTFGLEYLVLSVDINVPTPHIFIDGRLQNSFRKRSTDLWSLTKRLNQSEKLQDLEGDFYKYFNVYAADKDYLSAFTILAPNAMLALRDKGYSFDYEIYDGRLYVMHEVNLANQAAYEAFFEALISSLKYLIPQIDRHSYHDTDIMLQIGNGRLSYWALIYSLRVILWYFIRLFVFLFVLIGAGYNIGKLI